MIGKAIYSRLAGDATLAAQVGTRIYPQVAPQGTAHGLPRITYQQLSANRPACVDAASGYVVARVQVDCWAATYDTVQTVARLVRNRLHGHSGTEAGIVIGSILLDDGGDRDDWEPLAEGSDQGIHRVSLDLMVWYQDS